MSRHATDNQVRRNAAARGGQYSLVFAGDAHIDWLRAVGMLGNEKLVRRAFVRALDHSGRKGFTQVRRVLAKQVGLSQKRMVDLGRVQFKPARYTPSAEPAARIVSTGRYLPISEFRPTQLVAGTKASPWGRRAMFDGAFMFAGHRKSGKRMPGGHVFRNTRKFSQQSGRANLPVPVWGPSIPKEMVEATVAGEFSAARLGLGKRVAHEVSVLTKGIVGG